MAAPHQHIDPDQIDVIAPNLKRRLSGVTATIVRLVPVLSKQIGIVSTGPGLPCDIPHIPLWRVFLLPTKRRRVWHARRNTEMMLGLLLNFALRRNFKLVFTSASQRRHTRYTKWLISQMDAIVATSERSASYLEQPAKVIMHGIATEKFRPEGNIANLRAKLGLPNGVIIGCFGRFRKQKGTDVFVDAMIQIMLRNEVAVGVVLGRATDRHSEFLDSLRKKVASKGMTDRLLFLPEVSVGQVPMWYQALDLFVAPQRWEGFGLTPLEAMACGVPTVATRVGAFEAQIIEGVTGRLIAPGDVDAMAGAISEMLDSPQALAAAAAGKAAREHVLQNFRIEGEANALIEVYRDLLQDEVP